MVDVTEILIHWYAGRSINEVSASLGVDRKTIRKYLAPAVSAGLRPGDVIQEVNRKPVRSAAEFAREVEQARGRDIVVLVNRGGSTAYAVIERAG